MQYSFISMYISLIVASLANSWKKAFYPWLSNHFSSFMPLFYRYSSPHSILHFRIITFQSLLSYFWLSLRCSQFLSVYPLLSAGGHPFFTFCFQSPFSLSDHLHLFCIFNFASFVRRHLFFFVCFCFFTRHHALFAQDFSPCFFAQILVRYLGLLHFVTIFSSYSAHCSYASLNLSPCRICCLHFSISLLFSIFRLMFGTLYLFAAISLWPLISYHMRSSLHSLQFLHRSHYINPSLPLSFGLHMLRSLRSLTYLLRLHSFTM